RQARNVTCHPVLGFRPPKVQNNRSQTGRFSMRQPFLLVATFVLGLAVIPAAQAAAAGCIAPPSGLVSWWPGDSNNNDIVGSNNPNNVSGVTLVPAEVSNGFTLGKNGYLE